jgi:hypothetical protein
MVSWLLFVDESGNFDGPEGTVCLGGLLVEHGSLQTMGCALRRGIEKAYPHVPYPPHATELNLAAGHLAAWRRWPVRSVHAEKLRRANEEFESAIRTKVLGPLLQGFLNPEGERRRPRFESLEGCDQWLRACAPKALVLLEDVRDSSRLEMVDFLSKASSSFLKRGQRFLLTGVVECDRHEWDGHSASQDRYLALLRTLFEEVFLFLRSGRSGAGGSRTVLVRVASRGIYDAARELTVVDVGEQARSASSFPLYPPEAGLDTVDVEAQIEPKFDGKVHAGVVVADFLSNRLRRAARDGSLGWADVRQAIKCATGLAPDIVPQVDQDRRTKPAVAGQGASWDAITRAFAQRMAERADIAGSADSSTSVAPGWRRDCVESWAELARRIR